MVENTNELQRGKNGVISQASIHNEVDLIWSVLGFPWEIYFVQSELASPGGVNEFTSVNFYGLKYQYKEI